MGVHVLIGFAEALPTPEVIFSLAQAGHTVSVFTRHGTTSPLFTQLPVKHVYRVSPPERSVAETITDIRAIFAQPNAPDFIFALDDPALFLVNEAIEASSKLPRVANATGRPGEVALDKSQQIAHAREAGFAVPPTIVAQTPSDLSAATVFPAIAKSALAVEVDNGKLIKGKAQYLPDSDALAALKTSLRHDMSPLLVQPLIEGGGEGVFGFMTDNGVLAWSGHERVRMMNPHGSGSSACQTRPPSKKMQMVCEDFLTRINWRGPFMIELLRARDTTPYFMELNGRMWGSMALARRAGYEYPAWSIAQTLDRGFRPGPITPENSQLLLRHLGRDIAHLLFVMRGPQTDFHKSTWPKFGSAFVNVLKPNHRRNFYNYDPAHRWYFIRDAYDVVKKTIFKARG
ncbi:MAG: hypothetical protein ACRBCJ_14515 [Hyphomicrobiaceae bacterium]